MKKPEKNTQPKAVDVDLMKAFEQSKSINNFQTNFQFTKDLGIAMLQDTATSEHLKVLAKSLEGLEDFIDLLKEKMQEKKSK